MLTHFFLLWFGASAVGRKGKAGGGVSEGSWWGVQREHRDLDPSGAAVARHGWIEILSSGRASRSRRCTRWVVRVSQLLQASGQWCCCFLESGHLGGKGRSTGGCAPMRADQMSTQEAHTGSWKSESRVRDGGQRSPVTVWRCHQGFTAIAGEG